MPNLHKQKRNAEIVQLFDEGRGLTHKELASKFHMGEKAVSMVISRDRRRKQADLDAMGKEQIK